MKYRNLKALIILTAIIVIVSSCAQSCSGQKTPQRDNEKVIGSISSPVPDKNDECEHYAENMEKFGDFLNNICTYECVYMYFTTGDKDSAYDEAVKLKSKLLYAIEKDYYLTEDEITQLRTNIDGNLRMQYDTLDMPEEYSADYVINRLYGINEEQYMLIRMCETLITKCSSDMKEKITAEADKGSDEMAQKLKEFYESRKDSYDYTVIRYISYRLNTSDGSNKEITEKARKFLDRISTIEDMLAVTGGESDIQTEGTSNGQITVYMNDNDSIFYEFASGDGRSEGAKTLVYDSNNVYAAMSEGYYTYDTSETVAAAVKEDYTESIVEAEMTEKMLQYSEPEDWYVMSNEEEIRIAMSLDNYSNVIPRLQIADEASAVFVTVQDPGNVTSCRFYAYEKTDGKWSEVFKTAGYVGRSGIADTENRIEGNGTSPAGVYSFGLLFGIKADPGGLKKDYLKVDNDDYWDGDKNSDTYNQHVKGSKMPLTWNESASEHLIDYTYSYNYAAMVNFNVNPTVKGKGSAIFLHCTSPGSLASAGCISIPESKMLRALRMIDDNAYIVILRNAEDFVRYC